MAERRNPARPRWPAALLSGLVLVSFLCGCWNSRELNELAIVMGVAIDKGTKENVMVTVQVAKAQGMKSSGSESGKGGGEEAYLNIQLEGESVFGVLRNMSNMLSRTLYYPQNQILILGSDLAQEDAMQALDLFMRGYETRMGEMVLIAKGKAADMFNKKTDLEKLTSVQLAKIVEAQRNASQAVYVTLRIFAINMLSKSTAPFAPVVETYEDLNGVSKVCVAGTAVFKHGKLIGQLDMDQTRGLLWVLNDIKSGMLHVDVPGGRATLEIMQSNTKVKPQFEDGKFKISVKIEETVNYISMETTENLMTPENIKITQAAAAGEVQRLVMNAIDQAKSLNADVFGFGEAIRRKFPRQWKSIENDWDAYFPQLEDDVQAQVSLHGSGRITKPVVPGGAK